MPITLTVDENYVDLSENSDIFTCYSLRITGHQEYITEYIELFKKWLKEKLLITIIASSAGQHDDTDRLHFHYHCIVNEPEDLKRSPHRTGNQGFKDFMKKKENQGIVPMPENNDMRVQVKDGCNYNKVLRYPLKCGDYQLAGCFNIDVKQQMDCAVAIKAECAPKTRKELAKERRIALAVMANKCFEYLDGHREQIISARKVEVTDRIEGVRIINDQKNSYEEAIKLARHWYIKEDPMTSPMTAGTQAMKWLNTRGILTDEHYIKLYSPLSRIS